MLCAAEREKLREVRCGDCNEPERQHGKKSAGGGEAGGEHAVFRTPGSVHPASCALGEAIGAFQAEV